MAGGGRAAVAGAFRTEEATYARYALKDSDQRRRVDVLDLRDPCDARAFARWYDPVFPHWPQQRQEAARHAWRRSRARADARRTISPGLRYAIPHPHMAGARTGCAPLRRVLVSW